MRASLDTNVIIHFFKADLQEVLFEFFADGVFIYEQIRKVELENHGKEVLHKIDEYIKMGKIEVYTNEKLKDLGIFRVFENNVRENRMLYGSGDLGEVYAISLAQTLGAYALVTDDVKQGGPYMSLLQFEDDIMPFTFVDILILRYLLEKADVNQTIKDFSEINRASQLNWSFKSQMRKFVNRFWIEPYREADNMWIQELTADMETSCRDKLLVLKTQLD